MVCINTWKVFKAFSSVTGSVGWKIYGRRMRMIRVFGTLKKDYLELQRVPQLACKFPCHSSAVHREAYVKGIKCVFLRMG